MSTEREPTTTEEEQKPQPTIEELRAQKTEILAELEARMTDEALDRYRKIIVDEVIPVRKNDSNLDKSNKRKFYTLADDRKKVYVDGLARIALLLDEHYQVHGWERVKGGWVQASEEAIPILPAIPGEEWDVPYFTELQRATSKWGIGPETMLELHLQGLIKSLSSGKSTDRTIKTVKV